MTNVIPTKHVQIIKILTLYLIVVSGRFAPKQYHQKLIIPDKFLTLSRSKNKNDEGIFGIVLSENQLFIIIQYYLCISP